MPQLIITSTNGRICNVSEAHGVDFENMTEAIAYLKESFETDNIAKIELVEE